jgi:energy-coupling factor transporter ATP-binding protein EcfA2
MAKPLLHVDRVAKQYTRGLIDKRVTFSLAADFSIDGPAVVGVMGPNGSGKTTLFELITGSNLPSSGRVLVDGQDIHRVKTRERDRLAIHYHQSYQVRSFQRSKPDFMLSHACSLSPRIHLFDEPQFNTQDGYIGFMLDFFKKLRQEGKLVFLCLHPNEPYHIDILRESCEQFIYVQKGVVTRAPDFETLLEDERVRGYLGALAPDGRSNRMM